MTDIDQYGNIVDADTVEAAVITTLLGPDPTNDLTLGWLVGHIAHQERRKSLAPRSIPLPRSWPQVSEFDIELGEQMPAVVVISSGTDPGETTHDRGGMYRTTWRIEIAAAIAGRDQREARLLASVYLAAIKGALIQNPTLGDRVEQCRWTGNDDHAFGVTEKGSQRAIYAAEFAVTVRNTVSVRQGPPEPPADPYVAPQAPENPDTAVITVTATRPEDTP